MLYLQLSRKGIGPAIGRGCGQGEGRSPSIEFLPRPRPESPAGLSIAAIEKNYLRLSVKPGLLGMLYSAGAGFRSVPVVSRRESRWESYLGGFLAPPGINPMQIVLNPVPPAGGPPSITTLLNEALEGYAMLLVEMSHDAYAGHPNLVVPAWDDYLFEYMAADNSYLRGSLECLTRESTPTESSQSGMNEPAYRLSPAPTSQTT